MALELHHKHFLQVIMSAGIMSSHQVFSNYNEICEKYDVPPGGSEEMVVFLKRICTAMKPFHLSIRKGVCEIKGDQYYVVVNTLSNKMTRQAVDFKEEEIEFFKKLVQAIVESSDRKVSKTDILNDVIANMEPTGRKFTKHSASHFLEVLETNKWTAAVRGGITLGVRAIADLETYLKNNFSDELGKCACCNLICIQRQRCSNCAAEMHPRCVKKVFKKQKSCPACHESWFGESQDSESDDDMDVS